MGKTRVERGEWRAMGEGRPAPNRASGLRRWVRTAFLAKIGHDTEREGALVRDRHPLRVPVGCSSTRVW